MKLGLISSYARQRMKTGRISEAQLTTLVQRGRRQTHSLGGATLTLPAPLLPGHTLLSRFDLYAVLDPLGEVVALGRRRARAVGGDSGRW